MASMETIESAVYQQAAEIPGPELAKDWHCWSVLCEMAGDVLGAAEAELTAAWVCDDEIAVKAGLVFRENAIRHLRGHLEASAPSVEPQTQLLSVLLDLQRRTENFSDARSTIEFLARDGADLDETDSIKGLLQLQTYLVEEEDGRRFTFDDVKLYSRSPEKWQRRQRRRDSGHPWWRFW